MPVSAHTAFAFVFGFFIQRNWWWLIESRCANNWICRTWELVGVLVCRPDLYLESGTADVGLQRGRQDVTWALRYRKKPEQSWLVPSSASASTEIFAFYTRRTHHASFIGAADYCNGCYRNAVCPSVCMSVTFTFAKCFWNALCFLHLTTHYRGCQTNDNVGQ